MIKYGEDSRNLVPTSGVCGDYAATALRALIRRSEIKHRVDSNFLPDSRRHRGVWISVAKPLFLVWMPRRHLAEAASCNTDSLSIATSPMCEDRQAIFSSEKSDLTSLAFLSCEIWHVNGVEKMCVTFCIGNRKKSDNLSEKSVWILHEVNGKMGERERCSVRWEEVAVSTDCQGVHK